ncbi:MAG: heparinase II/III-family protein [Gemmatimonadota bacterium]|nr:heparinase II/III-family protein [Gemmatimonadota bacterium]
MTLLVTDAFLRERRAVARGALAPLAQGLRHELSPLIDAPVEVPREKALLSRVGGRCAVDGALLTFDPFDPRHRCPLCGREYQGELQDRFRLYWYQLWLAERALHGALLGALTDDAAASTLATNLLEQYADQYLRYPNADNVLGPSRPFFSTYLESIWLLQLTIALSILESIPSMDSANLGARVRERLILPSATLIASYDEGMSNRQVWNNAALMAASRMLGDRAMFERAVHGPSGLHAHLRTALLPDGSWYEGENYHLFAHRGLWYGERLASMQGALLPEDLERRYREAFAAPFRTILPDLTYPSRRDSQYAVSIRQPRFAESCELGLAYGDDERLTGTLARLYDPSIPRGETGRRASSADVERNLPATGLERADLSWRTLLCARAELPPLVPMPLESDLLPSQGVGIIRRKAGDVYVSLDYGHSGGGHGHPDRLNLTLMDGEHRWFDDPGTGSYVDPTLHWYRSTLAHNAPIIDGRSQKRVDGALNSFDDQGDAGWMSAHVAFPDGLVVRRSIVVLDEYLVDRLEWRSHTQQHEIMLPMHGVVPAGRQDAVAELVLGEDGAEDGFAFLEEVRAADTGSSTSARLRAKHAKTAQLDGWTFTDGEADLFSATAPAPPNETGRRPLSLIRQTSPSGAFISVWSWRGSVAAVERSGNSLVVTRTDGSRHHHAGDAKSWSIEGVRPASIEFRRDYPDPAPIPVLGLVRDRTAAHSLPATFELGAQSYRRSEPTWEEAGSPRASVAIASTDRHTVTIEIDVHSAHRNFIPLDAVNPFDNEPASINGDSVQLYAWSGGRGSALLLVPGSDGVDMRVIDTWLEQMPVEAEWKLTESGYRLVAVLDLDPHASELRLDVIINETGPGRARRRGQLVLSGGAGEFVYLRGDRHDPSRLLRFLLPQ